MNQTPGDLHPNNQQALFPSVHVSADGTVAVTYYDFRFNTLEEEGVPTDYWLVYADGAADLTNPANWTDEVRLTDESFNLQDAFYLDQAGFRRGYFIGDYEGLASDGSDFLTLFIQPVVREDDHGSVFFRRVRATGAPVSSTAGEAEFHAAALWYAQLEHTSQEETQKGTQSVSADLIDLLMVDFS